MVIRYAICGVILCAVIGGAYYLGYSAGADNTRVEYVTKEVEVIKYKRDTLFWVLVGWALLCIAYADIPMQRKTSA